MLRITVTESTALSRLKLEGRISGTSVEELRRLCTEPLAASGNQQLMLDLSDVSFIDCEGIALVRHLSDRKVLVINYSPFIAELLKEVVSCS